VLGFILHYERRWEEAEFQHDAAIRLNPNNADALVAMLYFQVSIGKPQEALQTFARALRLNPHPPGWYYWAVGIAQIANGQYENAVATLRREETYGTGSRYVFVAALALLGRTFEAQAEAKLLVATQPHWRISEWLANEPYKNPADAKIWLDAYRIAGLPE
jgi:adenylate cyclase